MGIGKYLTNMGVIGAVLGAFGTAKQTQAMPKDWRRFVVWGVWAAGLVLAVVGVAKQPADEEHEAALKELEQAQRAADREERRAAKARGRA